MFLTVLKLIISISLLISAIYIGGNVSFDIGGCVFEIHIAALTFFILILLYIYGFILALFREIISFLSGKPSYEKGIDQLQMAFSGILLKDRKLTEKSLKKAKKYLGSIPIVSWIEGQLMLANKDYHKAKAIFYELSGKEKDTALGAYSICNLAIKDRSSSDAINAINSIIKLYPYAYELIFQAIVICLRNRNFSEARKYIPSLKGTKKGRVVEAIIYFEEGTATSNSDLLKKAFKLAPELTENAIRYSEYLMKAGEYKSARKILMQSFKYVHVQEVYKKYISCGKNLSDSDVLKLAEKIANEIPNSWMVYFEFANCALQNDMKKLAFQNFLKAYEIEPYDFIADKLAMLLPEIETAVSTVHSNEPLSSKSVRFLWRCQHCGNESRKWLPICDHCDWIGEYKYEELSFVEENDDTYIPIEYGK